MAGEALRSCRAGHPYTKNEAVVFKTEADAITERRRAKGNAASGNYVGLALSGGGIRSASFNLGVIQALDTHKAIDCIDYLSTVSGGGYTGCCLTASMNATNGIVPFNEPDPPGGFGDTNAVHHIRDFSNYLMPRGFRDLMTSLALIGRGWAANLILLAPIFLISTFLLLAARPDVKSLDGYGPLQTFAVRVATDRSIPFISGFPDTTFFIFVQACLLAVWAVHKSLQTLRAPSNEVDAVSARSTDFTANSSRFGKP